MFIHETCYKAASYVTHFKSTLSFGEGQGLRFWQTTLSFPKVPRTITSPYPSILPNTDLIKGDAFEFCESTVTTNLRPLKANLALDVADR
jgi:hypothetical protein